MGFPFVVDEFGEMQSLLDEMITMISCSDWLHRHGLIRIGNLSTALDQFGVFVVDRCFVFRSRILVEPHRCVQVVVEIPVRAEEGRKGVVEEGRGWNLVGMSVGEVVDVVVAWLESFRLGRNDIVVVGIRERRETGSGE